ncbi:hypothetical protein [Hymenobacter sp. YC55]|uniref:hypothetical protein n=1 Tax=Hymenobacter sp. YC55 TaxID=3034019 RepID=UPI0023F70C0C|nr:hypothetical protein [Hymenobacter sp. YC55]MDF7810682.1 hypothetical protein [Hymenobacter sp. YC55]
MFKFKNISSGGLLAAVVLLAFAIIAFYLGFRDNHTNGDGNSMYWICFGLVLASLLVAWFDSRRHTKRLERKELERNK